MSLDDRTADRKSHTHPVGLGGVERVEQALTILRAQPRAGVSHGDEDPTRILHGADEKLSRPVTDAAHRFDSVDDQVEDHLLQLDCISLNAWQALAELCLHRDVVLYQFAPRQSNDLMNRFVDIEGILPRRRLLDESADPADDVYGSSAFVDGIAERLPGFLQIRRRGAQPARRPGHR